MYTNFILKLHILTNIKTSLSDGVRPEAAVYTVGLQTKFFYLAALTAMLVR